MTSSTIILTILAFVVLGVVYYHVRTRIDDAKRRLNARRP